MFLIKKSRGFHHIPKSRIAYVTLTIYLICITALLMTGCISKEEKQEGRETEMQARPIIKKYVRKTFGKDAKASNFKTVYIRQDHGSTVPNFSYDATDMVKADVKDKNNSFSIIYNIYNDKVWTDKHYDEIKKSITELNISGLPYMTGCMLRFYSHEISVDEENYAEASITDISSLCKDENYSLSVTCFYLDEDFSTLQEDDISYDLSSQLGKSWDINAKFVFVNCPTKEAYETVKEENFLSYVDSETQYYQSEEAKAYITDYLVIPE